jgi:hypothetical protein
MVDSLRPPRDAGPGRAGRVNCEVGEAFSIYRCGDDRA